MGAWTRFFIGTPRRFLFVLVFVFLASCVGAVRPDLLEQGLSNLFGAILNAAEPFMVPALTYALMIWAAVALIRSAFGKKKGGK